MMRDNMKRVIKDFSEKYEYNFSDLYFSFDNLEHWYEGYKECLFELDEISFDFDHWDKPNLAISFIRRADSEDNEQLSAPLNLTFLGNFIDNPIFNIITFMSKMDSIFGADEMYLSFNKVLENTERAVYETICSVVEEKKI